MKEFILLVRVPSDYNKAQAEAVNPEWIKVTDKWKKDQRWVTSFVFPGESYVVSGAERSARKDTVFAGNLKLVSNIILFAEDFEDALKLAGDCPILNYGGSVEVREVPPR